MRVLLVEDDGAIVRTLSELLADEGFSVVAEATQDGACGAPAAPGGEAGKGGERGVKGRDKKAGRA